jgi:putative transposase
MPIPKKYLADFEEGKFYHVFNRTNNKEKLFISQENHRFFLKKHSEYLSPFSETIAWCLLSNHFHFLIRIKSEELIKSNLKLHVAGSLSTTENGFLKGDYSLSELIESAYKRFFQSYALAFNKVHNRKGNLFYKPFKRLAIEDDNHFTSVIVYIHTNAVKHRVSDDFRTWQWSSYRSFIEDSSSEINSLVIDWFGGIEQFVKAHEGVLKEAGEYSIEA